jgi:SAM-dependent methyltransferase
MSHGEGYVMGTSQAEMPSHFRAVDSAAAPEGFIEYLKDAETEPRAMVPREMTYEAISGITGRGVDVGSGTGLAVAQLVARGQQAVGIDNSSVMISESRARFPQCQYLQAAAAETPFQDGELSWYRAERVYLHLDDVPAAVREARRVLKPGSPVVIADPDLYSTVFGSGYPDVTAKVLDSFRSEIPNPGAGTTTAGYLAEAGFSDIAVTAVVIPVMDYAMAARFTLDQALATARARGSLSEGQIQLWLDDLARRSRSGCFVGSGTIFVTTAKRA